MPAASGPKFPGVRVIAGMITVKAIAENRSRRLVTPFTLFSARQVILTNRSSISPASPGMTARRMPCVNNVCTEEDRQRTGHFRAGGAGG